MNHQRIILSITTLFFILLLGIPIAVADEDSIELECGTSHGIPLADGAAGDKGHDPMKYFDHSSKMWKKIRDVLGTHELSQQQECDGFGDTVDEAIVEAIDCIADAHHKNVARRCFYPETRNQVRMFVCPEECPGEYQYRASVKTAYLEGLKRENARPADGWIATCDIYGNVVCPLLEDFEQ